MNRPSEPFSEEQLREAWLQYAESIKKDKPRMFQVLKNHLPEKQAEKTILLQVASIGQKQDFHDRLESNLSGFLKEKLNNYYIELVLKVSEEDTKPNVVYTATDKFKYLSEQNELLNKLKQQFNLDIE